MSKSINQPVYYIPYVEILKDFDYFGIKGKKGDIFPIAEETMSYDFNKNNVSIMVHQAFGCNIIPLPEQDVKLFVNKLIPKFKLGEIVSNLDDNKSPFRIAQHCIIQGKIWYRTCWSVSTGFEGGRHEEFIRSAPECKDSWEIANEDDNLKKANSFLYKSIVSN